MSQGLSPCPKCGSEDISENINLLLKTYWIECKKCKYPGPSSKLRDFATWEWNSNKSETEGYSDQNKELKLFKNELKKVLDSFPEFCPRGHKMEWFFRGDCESDTLNVIEEVSLINIERILSDYDNEIYALYSCPECRSNYARAGKKETEKYAFIYKETVRWNKDDPTKYKRFIKNIARMKPYVDEDFYSFKKTVELAACLLYGDLEMTCRCTKGDGNDYFFYDTLEGKDIVCRRFGRRLLKNAKCNLAKRLMEEGCTT
jgi:hypothetical protein